VRKVGECGGGEKKVGEREIVDVASFLLIRQALTYTAVDERQLLLSPSGDMRVSTGVHGARRVRCSLHAQFLLREEWLEEVCCNFNMFFVIHCLAINTDSRSYACSPYNPMHDQG
jgi:hypothetical protein